MIDRLQHITPTIAISGGFVVWLGIVRMLRWRRYNAIHREYGTKWNNGLGKITPEEAQKIIHISTLYDMPLLLNYSLAFALFKTYGIPSISKLLAATKELKSKETVSKRYADTEILISTWVGCPISGFLNPAVAETKEGPNTKPADDPRANIALARVNWLHSKYNISNDDYLYTLCLFVLEPSDWADRYGWRSLSPLERNAFYVFWVEIGKRMGIRDIPGTLEELLAFSKEYETTHMVPAETNKEIAGYTVDELLSAAPKAFGVKAFGVRVVICLMDDIVRQAMMYPKQPWLLRATVYSLLRIIGFIQHFLLPPRISPSFPIDVRLPRLRGNEESLRLRPNKYAAVPWYRPEPTTIVSYCKEKLLVKLGWHSKMPSPQLKSTGYRLEEMGPLQFEQIGHEEIMKKAAELQGCPIAGPWSLEGRKQTS
ncbi:hypothetical protein BDZ97DRAFT_1658235 [Flammula alnicola]|nr:hypothetical protein BDZ97DRAFT_1658235 [Flammula alnicola]